VTKAAGNFRIVDTVDDFVIAGPALLACLENTHAVEAQVEHATERSAHAHRPRQRDGVHAKVRFDLGKQVQRLLNFAVQLVDEGDDGGVAGPAYLKQAYRLRLDTVGGVQHHQCGVHGCQHPVG